MVNGDTVSQRSDLAGSEPVFDMGESVDVETADAGGKTVTAEIAGLAIGLLRAITFAVLLVIYLVWVFTVLGRTMVDSNGSVSTFTNVLLGLAMLTSLPALGYVCTVRDRGGRFVAPTMMVVLLFLSYGLLSSYILLIAMALASEGASGWEVLQGSAVLSPFLAVLLTMLLAGITRTAVVWETAPQRVRKAKKRMYLAPTTLFLLGQALTVVNHFLK